MEAGRTYKDQKNMLKDIATIACNEVAFKKATK